MFVLSVVVNAGSLFILPPSVAIHFGADGVADGWASKEFNALFSLGLDLLFLVLIVGMPHLVVKIPPRLVNLPNKDYWLAPANRPATQAKMISLMSEFGVALFGFLALLGILTTWANLSAPVQLNLKAFFGVLAIFGICIAYWCIKLYVVFRIPGSGAAKS